MHFRNVGRHQPAFLYGDLYKMAHENDENQNETESNVDISNIVNSAVTAQLKREVKKMKSEFAEMLQDLKPQQKQEPVSNVEEKPTGNPDYDVLRKEIERLKRSNSEFQKKTREAEIAAAREKATNQIQAALGKKVPPHIQELLVPSLLQKVDVESQTMEINDGIYSVSDGISEYLKTEKGKQYLAVAGEQQTGFKKPPQYIQGSENTSSGKAQKAIEQMKEDGTLESFEEWFNS